MKSFLSPLIFGILLAALLALPGTALRAVEPSAEPLPVTVFQNLASGNKQTVVVYGTSLTINGAWTKALGDYLEKQFPAQVTFVNAAKAGMHSNWGVENLQERVLSKNPDLVFIEFSANDAAAKHNISLEQSEKNLDAMVKAIKSQNPKVDIVLQTMNPAWDSPKNAGKKYGSDRPNLEAYYDVYRKYAQAQGLPLVDNYPVWLKMQKDEPEKFEKAVSDGIHPHSGPSVAVTWPAVESLLKQAQALAAAGNKGATP